MKNDMRKLEHTSDRERASDLWIDGERTGSWWAMPALSMVLLRVTISATIFEPPAPSLLTLLLQLVIIKSPKLILLGKQKRTPFSILSFISLFYYVNMIFLSLARSWFIGKVAISFTSMCLDFVPLCCLSNIGLKSFSYLQRWIKVIAAAFPSEKRKGSFICQRPMHDVALSLEEKADTRNNRSQERTSLFSDPPPHLYFTSLEHKTDGGENSWDTIKDRQKIEGRERERERERVSPACTLYSIDCLTNTVLAVLIIALKNEKLSKGWQRKKENQKPTRKTLKPYLSHSHCVQRLFKPNQIRANRPPNWPFLFPCKTYNCARNHIRKTKTQYG